PDHVGFRGFGFGADTPGHLTGAELNHFGLDSGLLFENRGESLHEGCLVGRVENDLFLGRGGSSECRYRYGSNQYACQRFHPFLPNHDDVKDGLYVVYAKTACCKVNTPAYAVKQASKRAARGDDEL